MCDDAVVSAYDPAHLDSLVSGYLCGRRKFLVALGDKYKESENRDNYYGKVS